MTATAWSVLVGMLAIAVTILLFFVGRLLSKLDARDAEIALLRESNLTYRLAVIELKGTRADVRATLDALPTSTGREGTSP